MAELTVSNAPPATAIAKRDDACRSTAEEARENEGSFLAILVRSLEVSAVETTPPGEPTTANDTLTLTDESSEEDPSAAPSIVPLPTAPALAVPSPSFIGLGIHRTGQDPFQAPGNEQSQVSHDGAIPDGLNSTRPAIDASPYRSYPKTATISEDAAKPSTSASDEKRLIGKGTLDESMRQISLHTQRSEHQTQESAPLIDATASPTVGNDRPIATATVQTFGINLSDAAGRPLMQSTMRSANDMPHHYDIQRPIGSPEWPTETGQIIRIMTRENISEAQIRVNPPELGPIDIIVKQDGDGTSIAFSSHSSETRALLESHMPKLREALDAAGLQLTDASVNSGGSQRDSRGQFNAFGTHRPPAANTDEQVINASQDIVLQHGSNANRLIDIFA